MRYMELMPRMTLPLALLTVVSVTACNQKDDASRDVALRTDSTVMPALRDSVKPLEVVQPPAPEVIAPAPVAVDPAPVVAAPKPAARPRTPRATAPAPRPTQSAPTPAATPSNTPAPEPARARGEIASGTSFRVTNGAKVCSNTLVVGERHSVTTSAEVSGSNGVSIPAGSRVSLLITKSKVSGSQNDPAELAFDVRSVTFGGETYTASGDVSTEAIVMERKGGDGKKVAIGAAAGAVIGNVIGGGSRGQRTVVGAAAGGLAGAAAAAITGDRFMCLPEGAALNVRLGSAMSVRN